MMERLAAEGAARIQEKERQRPGSSSQESRAGPTGTRVLRAGGSERQGGGLFALVDGVSSLLGRLMGKR